MMDGSHSSIQDDVKTTPITPARLAFDPDGTPKAPDFGDVYHARSGAFAQAQHVFLSGNSLPGRWQGRDHFVILETGFGLGNNFLCTWQAWRNDLQRSQRLTFISIEKHPLQQDDLRQALRNSPAPELAAALIEQWPVLTPNIHTIDFDDQRVRLMLCWGDVQDIMPQLMATVDAFYLDGFSPALNPPMWQSEVLERLGRLARREATVATWSAARSVRDGLTQAGFEVEKKSGFAGKRDMTVGVFRPRFMPIQPPAGLREPQERRRVLIIGGGLAGTATTLALSHQGWSAHIIDRASTVAQGASGNAAGLFHGTFNLDDGPHARWHRAAALHMARLVPSLLSAGVSGQMKGLLRFDAKLTDDDAQALSSKMALPSDYVRWLTAEEVSHQIGIPHQQGAWFLAQGGWLNPAQVCQQWLNQSGATFQGEASVIGVTAIGDDTWRVLLSSGEHIDAAHVVLANGHEAARLLCSILPFDGLQAVRGQTTLLPSLYADSVNNLHLQRPVAGAGYAVKLDDGRVMCGATTQHHDQDPNVRPQDHEHNLKQLERLTNHKVDLPLEHLQGRVAWRATTRDRLPLIGAVPALPLQASHIPRRRQARRWGQSSGLYVITGLASRGITTAALSGEVLGSWITGAPCPIEADLRDALDVARYFTAPSPITEALK